MSHFFKNKKISDYNPIFVLEKFLQKIMIKLLKEKT